MKKLGLFLLAAVAVFSLAGCLPKKQKAALQISTNPAATVIIDGKPTGKTPYENREMDPGEITVKLVPEDETSTLTWWEGKIKLVGGVLSVITRDFAESEEMSSGEILSLEPIRDQKSASLTVVTMPDGATVKVDEENRGFSPLVIDKIAGGEHRISLMLDGYKERTTVAKAVNGYRLILNVTLGKEEGEQATPAANLTPSVTGSTTASPTPKVLVSPSNPTVTPKAAAGTPATGSITIKGTPDGWLRVRSGPGTSYAEVARVNEGEKYSLLEESPGWYKIAYQEGKEGWISSQYTSKTD